MLRFALFALLFLTLACPAMADDASLARSAFTYAHHKDWADARAEAKRSDDPLLAKLIEWQYVLDPDSGAGFEEITRFIKENPDWPDEKKLHLRAELALKDNRVPDNEIIDWFKDSPPATGIGKIALAEAYRRLGGASQEEIAQLIRDAWRGGDFDEAQEKAILKAHGNVLRRADDLARADRLLWEEKITETKWMLPRIPGDYQKLYKARMALIEDKRSSAFAVLRVPKSLKSDPGLIYDRMRYRLARDDDKGVREMLLAAPAHVPYPEKWWKVREVQVRKAIGERNYGMARRLLAGADIPSDGSDFAEATWLEGWLDNEFLNQPEKAYKAFERIYDAVRFPASKARAAYWAGRAEEKLGQEKTAGNWYSRAAAYPTTFYGQLAALKASGAKPLSLPDAPDISSAERRDFDQDELVEAVRLCVQAGENELARHFVSYLVENADNDSEVALAVELGNRIDDPALSVHAANKALQQNVVLITAGYPTLKTPGDLPIERALALAIIRQESEFDGQAKSPSGALGMMQIMPKTAREVARKNGIRTWLKRLFEPDHNVTIGSHYLARLISGYDGSWILAIAAYNAGPGNVHRWVKTFGAPGNDADNAIDWIEKIPYDETRSYVQHVLENAQVYRAIDSGDHPPTLQLAEDLMR